MQVPSNMFLNYIDRPSVPMFVSSGLGRDFSLYGCYCEYSDEKSGKREKGTDKRIEKCCWRDHVSILGGVEAAFFPGCIYYLSRWYTRNEMQLRVTILNSENLAAQVFGGLIAV